MKAIKWSLTGIVVAIAILVLIGCMGLRASLPNLDGDLSSTDIKATAKLSRDLLGTAIIDAESEFDAAYLLGYAHAQDRLFQMDLLRRQSAGELSEIVGERALPLDKKHRIHQFRQRAQNALLKLTGHEQLVLAHYTKGVNAGANSLSIKPFEYMLTGSEFAPWRPADSLLASYSMYIDLQLAQTEIDFGLTVLKELYGEAMFRFFTLPSNYQSAMDGSVIPPVSVEIPNLLHTPSNTGLSLNAVVSFDSVLEQPDYGSNNWAVAGKLTPSTSAMLSNDMHLGLRVPAIWYRAQLNYLNNEQAVKVTGVSLPGTPAVVVGSNGHIAWGFTNANVDNVDWVQLQENTPTTTITELIVTPTGTETFAFEMSEYGPVREFNGQRYALKWVAHQGYAVNLLIADIAKMTSMEEALNLSRSVRMPVQNMVVADRTGKVAYQLTGAMSKRVPVTRHAITEDQYSNEWENAQFSPANHVNPDNGRVWSANARVIGTEDLKQFGDGGYALGARQQQIANLLKQQESFAEADFYDIQLNNQALFLTPWHSLLLETLSSSNAEYAKDVEILNNWQACACSDSIGYTLVRRFRSTVINQLLAPIGQTLESYDMSTTHLLRGIEPSIWAILKQQPQSWLPKQNDDYNSFLISAYNNTKARLIEKYSASSDDLIKLRWGNANKLLIKHPFSGTLGPLSNLVDMPAVEGFGDSYMPAVQTNSFGASERLIVRPGDEDNAILTVPGGQSGHFLSPYYRSGFDGYAAAADTPLLPSAPIHTITFSPID